MDDTTPPATDTPEHAEFLRRFPMGDLNEKMGVRLLEASPERVVGTMPVKGNTQPYGLLHGGASVVRNVWRDTSKATATCDGCSSRSALMSIEVKP